MIKVPVRLTFEGGLLSSNFGNKSEIIRSCTCTSLKESVHFVDACLWHVVNEETEENDEQNKKQDFEQSPLVVGPQNVLERLPRVEKPDERSVWSSATV